MTALAWIAPLPVGAAPIKAALRTALTQRVAFALTDAEDWRNFVAVDPADGSLPQYVIQVGRLFEYDSTDSTTAHDGSTCLVSNDGKRYKVVDFSVPWSVTSRINTPPGSPSVGDAYIITAAATGAWSGHDNAVAVFTQRGWNFVTVPIYKAIGVTAEDSYYHRNAGGTWTQGLASLALSSSSIEAITIIGEPVRWFVANQTTNAPPGSPAVGDAYIVGPTPSGAWTGHTLAIAQWNGSSWRFILRTGELAFDIAQGQDYRFNGTAWVATNTTTVTGTAVAATSAGAMPARGSAGVEDSNTVSYTARGTGKLVRFFYQARVALSAGGSAIFEEHTVGLFRDAETTAIAFTTFATYNPGGTRAFPINVALEITTADTSAHTYAIKIFNSASESIASINDQRRLRPMEFA